MAHPRKSLEEFLPLRIFFRRPADPVVMLPTRISPMTNPRYAPVLWSVPQHISEPPASQQTVGLKLGRSLWPRRAHQIPGLFRYRGRVAPSHTPIPSPFMPTEGAIQQEVGDYPIRPICWRMVMKSWRGTATSTTWSACRTIQR